MQSATAHPAAQTRSLARRAVLALVLMVGFYLLAIGIAALLLFIPYAEYAYAHRLHGRLLFACLIGAGAILWAILPRIDKFEAPGEQLSPSEHPRLFEELRAVAAATGQEMPAEVYLVPEVNAWVAQRGGMMGFGSRRVMGLGLPLMQALSVSQFRAVLAHEFGHYYGGDTALGPWIYKTRAAIERTLNHLGGSWLQQPFIWYGNFFLRVTHAISRQQEYTADALAARVIGARPLIDGLHRVRGAALAFDAYWSREVVPVLNAGYRPPLAEGFARFLSAPEIASAVDKHVAEALEKDQSNPYDTHPALPERVAALAQFSPGTSPASEPSAISLLEHVLEHEARMLATLADKDKVGALKLLSWDDAAQAFLSQWQAVAQENAATLARLRPTDLPELARDLAAFGRTLTSTEPVPEDARAGYATYVLGAGLATTLHQRGWRIDAQPGAEVLCINGTYIVAPFGVVTRLAEGTVSAEEWQRQCGDMRISDVPLA